MKKFLLFLMTILCSLNGWADVTAGKFLINRYDNNSYCKINGLSSEEKKKCTLNSFYELVIPATITYEGKSYPVKGIEDNAFNPTSSSNTSCYRYIRTVNLSGASNLITIGSYAFCGKDDKSSYSLLQWIIWPTSRKLTTIKDYAFKNCVHLEPVILPEGLTTIGDYAFENTRLGAIEIPSTITSLSNISSNAFYNNDGYDLTINSKSLIENDYTVSGKKLSTVFPNMKTVNFSGNITKIGKYAFYGCAKLESFDLKNVTEVGENAFIGCNNLKEMDLKNLEYDTNVDHSGLETIRISTTSTIYIKSVNVKHVIFGSNISTFKSAFFQQYDYTKPNQIESVTFENPDGVDIPDYAFGNQSESYRLYGNLKTVTGKINSIGDYAFAMMGENSGNLTTIDLSSATRIGIYAFHNQALREINLKKVKTVEISSFENCRNLSSIGIVYSWDVESVGKRAFKNTALSDYEIRFSECKAIGDYAFDGVKIKNVNLSSKCETVGENAFANNSSLQSITVYGDISESAFQNCPNLETVSIYSDFVANPTKEYTYDSNISRYFGNNVKNFKFYTKNVASNALNMYPKVTTLYFGIDVESVGDGFATFCPELTTIEKYSSYCPPLNVGGVAFSFCPKLKTVSGKFGELGVGAFGYCSLLDDVDFNNYGPSLSNEVFIGCSSLVTIKNSGILSEIGDRAFKNCSSFTGEGMTVSDYMTTIGEEAFLNCTNLKKMPNFPSVENVKDRAFKGCTNLGVNMDMLPKVTTIGKQAFMDCGWIVKNGGYSTTEIPETVVSIGDEAFKGDYMHAGELKLNGNNLESLGKEAFVHVYSLTINCPTYLAKNFTTDNNILSSVKFLNAYGLYIGEDVTAIGDNAFNNKETEPIEFSSIISLSDSKVTTLGTNCFKGLKTGVFYISGHNPAKISKNEIEVEARYLYMDGINFKSEYTNSDNLLHAFSDSLEFVDINGMKSDDKATIPDYAFYNTDGNKTKLKNISGYYNTVGKYAFANNTNLKSANFELLETIGDYAFANCSGLESVDISDDDAKNPVSIGEYAFQGNSLKMITIHRGKIAAGARGDATCNEISVASTAFDGQKPWLLMDMSDQVNVECNENTKVITNTEAKANEYRNRATNAPRYVTSIQRMECKPEDVDMDGGPSTKDVQAIYEAMRKK